MIPKTFTLGGIKWKVVQRKRLKGVYGLCDLKKQQIQILEGQAPEMKMWTFYHELTHAILFAMGKDQEVHNEEFIDGFATFLSQFMATAEFPSHTDDGNQKEGRRP